MWPRIALWKPLKEPKNMSDSSKVLSKNEIIRILQSETGGYENIHIVFHNKNFTEKGVIEVLEAYIGREIGTSIRSKNDEEIWSMAVAKKMKRVVEYLLEKFKYTIDKSDMNGNSIAHLLVNSEKETFFQFLTSDNDQSDNEIVRIENAGVNFVEWLMSKGVDFSRQNHEGQTALNLSIKYNLQHISRVLMKYTHNIHRRLDEYNQSLLHLFLETHNKYRDKYRGNNFKAARYHGYILRHTEKCVKLLLDKGVSALAYNRWDQTPLYMAIKEYESMSIIKMMIRYLLEKSNVATAIFVELLKSCAWWHGSRTEYFLSILRQLVNRGADVNAKGVNGTTPVYWAFQAQNRGVVAILNDYHADFSILTEHDENLLHALSKRLDPSLVPDDTAQEALFDLLLKKGCCDINAKTKTVEETPLHFASESGYLAVVRKLVEHGAEVDCKNTSGETPLHLAVHSNSAKVAEFLLKNNANVNSRDNCGRWPLYHTSTSEHKLMLVPLLLKWGAYVNVQIAGESPFSRAIRHSCRHNAREMLAYGADINDDCVIELLPSTNSNYTGLQLLLMQHWIKLNTAELPVSKKYADTVKFSDHEKFYSSCTKEVEKLKETFIDDHTSIYTFLRMNFARRRVVTNGDNLKALINSPTLGNQFPMYAVVILASYRETVLRKSLLEPAERAWFELTGLRLPIECLQYIFSYLRNADLLGMIEYEENA